MTVTAPRIDAVFDLDALLDDEEREWQQRARRFAQERILPVIEDDFEHQHFRSEFVRELGELGFLGMHLTGYGCAGAGAVSYGLVCLELEAADSGWRTFVSVQGSLAMSAIHKYGSEEQKQRWLPGMAAGELIGCFALTEPQGGSDPAAMTTVARRDGDGWVLDGAKRWIGLASHRRRGRGLGARRRPVGGVRTGRQRRARLPRADDDAGLHRHADRRQALDARVGAVRRDPRRRCGSTPMRCCPGHRGSRGPSAASTRRATASSGAPWARPARASRRRSSVRSRARCSASRSARTSSSRRSSPTCSSRSRRGSCSRCTSAASRSAARSRRRRSRSASSTACARRSDRARGAYDPRGRRHHERWPVMRHAANLESVRTYEGTDEIHQLMLGRALTGLNAF